MADSLVLTGVKGVKKHTGTEMVVTRPKRGGDSHLVKEWWKSGVSTLYATCTIIDVTTAVGTVKLVLDTSADTNVRIEHDGSFGFTFGRANGLKRAALFTDSMELIEHYVFPAISGGKVMTVTPAGAASRPTVFVVTGIVTGLTITDGGTGYTADDTAVNASGGSGSGLIFDYTSDGDAIDSITLVAGGQNYNDGETVTVSDGNSDAVITVTVA